MDHHDHIENEGSFAAGWLWALVAAVVTAALARWFGTGVTGSVVLALGVFVVFSVLLAQFWEAPASEDHDHGHQSRAQSRAWAPLSAEDLRARLAKRIGFTLVGTMFAWLIVQEVGAQYGWPPKYALLADLAALAAFVWTLVATYRLWRLGQTNRP